MAIFTIGDLHLSLGTDKPMDVFKGWANYVEKLETSWRAQIEQEDIVVLAGDTSWAMKLEDCRADFAFLQSLPGKKLLLKGNHDYWWNTLNKMQAFCNAEGFTSIDFLHNNCFFTDEFALCGTRSWLFDVGQAHDEKVMAREIGRLTASLSAAKTAEKIVFLHYPPICHTARAQEIIDVMQKFGVKQCFYGHLHGGAIQNAVQGTVDGIAYRLISADALQFCPVKISGAYRNVHKYVLQYYAIE